MLELEFSQRGGTDVRLILPYRDDPNAGELVEAAADALYREFEHRVIADQRAEDGGRRKRLKCSDALLDWFRPLAYRLIGTCLEQHLEQHLFRRSLVAGRYRRGSAGTPSLFQLGLMALLAENPALLTDDERQQVGLIMWHAYRHYVPTCFVNGFARQVGALDVTTAQTVIEPYFEDWIVERRVLDFAPVEARGSYPPPIETRIKRLRGENAQNLGSLFKACG